MALQSFLAIVAGKFARVFPVQASTGSASAGSLVALNAAGVVDATMLATRTPISDASYTALTTDRTIAYTALTASRTVTLPAAANYPGGTALTIVDETGACSPTVTITVTAAGSDTINGAATAVLSLPYGYLTLKCNTSNKWTLIDGIGTAAALNVANAIPGNTPGSLGFSLYAAGNTTGQFAACFDQYSGSSSSATVNANLVFRQARGTPASPATIQTGDRIGGFGMRGYGATMFSTGNKINIIGVATQNWTDSAQGCALTFQTTPNGSITNTEVARFDSTGFFGIGTTTPAYPLDVAGTTRAQGFISTYQPQTGWNLDSSQNTQSLANNGTITLAAGSGLIILNNVSNGDVGLYVVGGGSVALLGQSLGTTFATGTSPSSGQVALGYANGAYTITSNFGSTITLGAMLLRTRNAS